AKRHIITFLNPNLCCESQFNGARTAKQARRPKPKSQQSGCTITRSQTISAREGVLRWLASASGHHAGQLAELPAKLFQIQKIVERVATGRQQFNPATHSH